MKGIIRNIYFVLIYSLVMVCLIGIKNFSNAAPILFPDTGNYYDFVPGAYTWNQANSDAVSKTHLGKRGHLAAITSLEEDNFIRSNFSSQVNKPLGPLFGATWSGTGTGPTEGWSWITGEAFSYTGWNVGEPNHKNGENVIHFSLGGWNDILSSRTDTIGYLIEYGTCSHSISPVSEFFDSSGGTGSLSVSAPVGCDWTAVSDASWLNIDSGSSGSGAGTVNYTVSANAGTNPRVGTISIADETFTVPQLGTDIGSCNPFSLSSSRESLSLSTASESGSSGGAGSLSVTAPDSCGWTATSEASWIFITTSSIGSGDGTVNVYITPNTSASLRTGEIRFADWKNCTCKIFTVTQDPLVPCTSTITPTSDYFNAIGGKDNNSIEVKDPCNNGWTATSNDPSWLIITSGDSGSGDGTVKYKVEKNPSKSLRTGSMTIAGQTFTVVQEGMKSLPEPKIMAMGSDGVTVASVKDESSSIALKSFDPVSISVSLTEGNVKKGINADWWLVASTGSAWYYYDLILGWTPGFSVTHQGPLFDLPSTEVLNMPLPPGTYTFYFGVDTIMNGILDFDELHYEFVTAEIIKPEGDSCNVTISVPSKSFDFTGGPGSFSVNDPCNNGWMIKSNCAWVHITSGNNSGTGNGTVQYLVDFSHARATSRECGINVSVETFEVEQTKNTITDE